jgi:hypothetical protein
VPAGGSPSRWTVNSEPVITIDRVYPWGRPLDEYRRMFALTDRELASRIVSVADGPASFNAEMRRQGRRVVSCDPLYHLDGEDIRGRVALTREKMLDLVRRDAHRFVWDVIRSPEELGEIRTRAALGFLDDFDAGKREGRYLPESLPSLSFPDDSFDLAICSHFLFLYADEFSLDFHVASVREMMRVAPDVRIFPLLDMRGEPSAHAERVIEAVRRHPGVRVERRRVEYEFQRGGNEMLHVTR